jgi:cellulose synthase/poly-beta-1,6-N-acetylglucosamine synthase-like glycosyltransferase/CheY-like chemotaxis protein
MTTIRPAGTSSRLAGHGPSRTVMTPAVAALAIDHRFDDAAQVLIVGDCRTAEAATMLAPDGISTVIAADGGEVLANSPMVRPDVIVLGQQQSDRDGGGDVVDRLRSREGTRPTVVVLGEADARKDHPVGAKSDTGRGARRRSPREYLPADVGVAQLADYLRGKLGPPPADGAGREAISDFRLDEETHRELQRATMAARPGMLAAVSVAELAELRRRLGAKAEQALVEVFEKLLAQDAHVLEQHAVCSDVGFLILMPETTVAVGRDRLQRLAGRISSTVLDVAGEQLRITPVIGYSSFANAATAHELRDQAGLALDEAVRHLDLLPVAFLPAMALTADAAPAPQDRLLAFLDRLRSPMQIAFSAALLLMLPFIVYVLIWYAGFDLTRVTYPLVAAALAVTAAILWIECFRAVGDVDVPALAGSTFPTATAIVAAYLPNEAATIVDTMTTLLTQDYPGEMQLILAYNSPQRLPVEDTLEAMAARDSRLQLLRVEASTSKAQNVNAALAHVRGRFVGIFDADHHPAPGSFERAWRWISNGHDIVQGHCVVRNGNTSWVSRLVAVEFETIYAVSHPGRARLHGFGIFGGSNGYWRTESLRRIRMQGTMLTEDIDSSMRSLLDGFSIVSDPGLISTELAPTTMSALWNQRMRWSQGWTQTALRHLRPAMTSPRLSLRQKVGAVFLLGWTQAVPWITVQVLPILAFTAWRDGGVANFDLLIPLFVLLTVFTASVGIAQTVFAYLLSDNEIRRHRWWFVFYALNSMLWFGEFKNIISRVAQLKELVGERQWRVTPRAVPADSGVEADAMDGVVSGRRLAS